MVAQPHPPISHDVFEGPIDTVRTRRMKLTHLKELESESIFVLREVAAQFERPVLLFSGGKDSIVVSHLARKAFWPAKIPFPLMHIDTGHNFPKPSPIAMSGSSISTRG
jgi:3'-phosphoadenosine 5'-phosphosulfate sulfotransferase (PAPS reductase)/FAD synthetase